MFPSRYPRRFLVIGLWLICAGSQAVRAEDLSSLADQIRKLALSPALGKMQVGLRVDVLGSATKEVCGFHDEDMLKPASNQKIITTAAAIALLPPDFVYQTVLARRGDDLIIIGSGDPSTGDPRIAKALGQPITAVFHRWAERLAAAGLTSIKGNLLFDDTIFELEHVHPSWRGMFNLQDWYAAPVGGLNFNDNCVDVQIKPGPMSQPAQITLIPNTTWVQLKNNSVTAKKGEPTISRTGEGPITISVGGSVSRPNSVDDPFSLTIVDPGAFFASTCRTALAAKGITIQGQTRRQRVRLADGSLPKDLQIIAIHESRLPDFLWRVNKCSQNMFAEALFKTVGYYTTRDASPRVGTNANARAAVTRFVAGLGVPVDNQVFDDGCGLSHHNRTSAATIVAVLRFMDGHPRREVFRSSLAVPGEEIGTLKKRMKDMAGRVIAKTGTISGVSSLSGYVEGPGGRRYAFSVLCNDTGKAKGGVSAAHKLQDDLCRLLAGWSPAQTDLGG